ncbi:Hypothetical protein R9X50_00413700 [Acrodontium crateriforme]|uniref:S-adenosyl-L-methionine-dependent methyltransferase n=1 Tax=Acrodontium crateriforme TaxID=150365 RepID=A0AAQ3M705_9PEZI|nr:Hypothetical protein R9X50_00413700 [Acrodontium crateriforme]
MPFDIKKRWNSYTEPALPLKYAIWYLLSNLGSGFHRLGTRTFAMWYSSLGHHFARFEEQHTPVPRLVGMAQGAVLDVGPGPGNQLSRFNPSKIIHVYGIEPNDLLLGVLRERLNEYADLQKVYTPINASLEDDATLCSYGISEGSIDTLVCMQVLCSVSDPMTASKRLYKLLKPGGQLLFWEHQSSKDTTTRVIQRFWDLIWSPLIGNCHLASEAEKAIMSAGEWEIQELGYDESQPYNVMPRVWGHFVKPQ